MTTKGRAKSRTRTTWSEIPGNRGAGSNGGDLRRSLVEAHGFEGAKVARFYPRGSILFSEGQRLGGVYVLSQGRAKVSVTSAEGKTFLVRIASSGDLLGVKAVLTNSLSGATVEALDHCLVDFITSKDLQKLLDCDVKACLGIAHSLSNKLDAVMSHTRLLLLSRSAEQKFARLIVRWCDEHGKHSGQEIQIDHGLTHEEIAQMICTSRETVTRLFSEFKRKNILGLINGSMVVFNRKSLESIAGY